MLALSPLGKVPVLLLADGERLWDSRAILDFLHGQAPADRNGAPMWFCLDRAPKNAMPVGRTRAVATMRAMA